MIAPLKIILLPLSWLYGWMTDCRNRLYDMGIMKSYSLPVHTVGIGNLELGGTGKTPFVEFLLHLYNPNTTVAVLSRGYRRKTKGYLEVKSTSSFLEVGDEIKQIKNKFPNVPMAVCEDRVEGIKHLLTDYPYLSTVILDDAFQHRRLQCDEYFLLTRYDRLYTNDNILPLGRLRERKSNAAKANTIVVTKCPPDLVQPEKLRMIKELKPLPHQSLIFTSLHYSLDEHSGIPLVITGIAHPYPLFNYIRKNHPKAQLLIFPDHHPFNDKDVNKILSMSFSFDWLITTEKDLVRLSETRLLRELKIPLSIAIIKITPLTNSLTNA